MTTLPFQTLTICLLLASMIISGCSKKSGTDDSKSVQTPVDTSTTTTPASATPHDSVLTQEAARHSLFFLRDGDIWLATEDGKQQRQITRNEHIDNYYWIPAAQQLIYDSYESWGDSTRSVLTARIKVRSLNSDTAEVVHCVTKTEVVEHEEFNDSTSGPIDPDYYFGFSVSEDGGKILYWNDFLDQDWKGTVAYDIATRSRMYLKGEGVKLSPDGKLVAWILDNNIYVTSLEDSTEKQVTQNPSGHKTYEANPSAYERLETVQSIVSWTVDSKKILYFYGSEGHGGQTYCLYALDVDSLTIRALTPTYGGELVSVVGQSADGHTICCFGRKFFNGQNQDAGFYLVDPITTKAEWIFTPDQKSADNVHFSVAPVWIAYDWFPEYGKSGKRAISLMWHTGQWPHKILDDASHPQWAYKP